MKAQKILWLIMLSLLLVIEIILGLISCNPTSDFSGMSTYSIQTQTQTDQGVSDNQTPVTGAEKVLLQILPIIFIVVILLGAVSFMGYRS